jgi:hypothetical protein
MTPGHTWLGYSYSALPAAGNVELIITISYTSYIFPNGNAAPLVPYQYIIKLPK